MIICSQWVLPVTSPPIRNGAICVRGSFITDVGSRREILKRNPNEEVADFGESVILPGLVNCHIHLKETLWRGTIDNNNFVNWGRDWVDLSHRMPVRLTKEDLYYSCKAGLSEAIRSGTTCLADVCTHGYSIKPLVESKIRAVCFIEAYDQIGTWMPNSRTPKRDSENVLEAIKSEVDDARLFCRDSLVDIGIAPSAPYSSSQKLIEGIAKTARKEKLRLGIHLSESKEEVKFIKDGGGVFGDNARELGIPWTPKNMSPVEYLHSIGFLGEDVLAAHCVHVNKRDVEIIAENKVGVVHDPVSNAKLANGVSPLTMMLKSGIDVSLGTDGAQTNNSLNMIETMKFIILLQRAIQEKPVLTAQQVLKMATINGAKVLGLDHQIGSLEKGKKADLIAVNLSTIKSVPTYDPLSSLVYTSISDKIDFVMVNGEVLLENGNLHTINEKKIVKEMNRIRDLVSQN